MPLRAKDFIPLYTRLGEKGFDFIPELLKIAREEHKIDFPFDSKNFEQSWRVVKGKGLEKILELMLKRQICATDLEILRLSDIGEKLKIDFGEYGNHYPDVDLVVYQPRRNRILAILSIKASLRERATQTAYWRLKLRDYSHTRNVKVYLLTPNSDDILRNNHDPIKQRAVLETDIDGIYIVNTPERSIDDYLYPGLESRIRLIDDLIDDLADLAARKYL
ncbi:MAG: BsaWI family type II restriction enzyme [Chloroflexota bacterium]|nr:BsaWI family type II restriction enzyme [Chloroflexota bacterium]MDE2946095.1 BsaWI family type II restriction enzyme [Chloroflexota bacterium]